MHRLEDVAVFSNPRVIASGWLLRLILPSSVLSKSQEPGYWNSNAVSLNVFNLKLANSDNLFNIPFLNVFS